MTMEDADLVRYLDGELDAEGVSLLEARLREDAAAAGRLEELRRRSAALSTMLRVVDPTEDEVRASAARIRPAPSRPPLFFRGPAMLRLVAALAVFLGLVLAVPAARAWVVEGARVVGEALRLVAPAPPAAEGPPEASPGPAIQVHFAARGDTFEVQVPAGGSVLHVRRGIDALGTADGAGILVLPGALRLEDDGAGAHRIVLPAGVSFVRVRVGDGPPTTYTVPADDEELLIDTSGG